ncbi:MAG: WbqC family protein [Bacteroidaceae bacterium]|nr:WbqC family protein [Bacteroidaceae bacterium]
MDSVLLSTAYLAPVSYYCRLAARSQIFLEQWEHYVKQSYRNRCLIATASGVQALCVPVERHFSPQSPIRDLRISDHGNWRHQHWQALLTAYDRSPYFEYYADDLRPFYERKYDYLLDFNEALREMLCGLLDIHPNVKLTETYEAHPAAEDLRLSIHPKNPAADAGFRAEPYYQVFAQRHGFLPNLSVVDLLFNLGPEAIFVLQKGIVPPA